MSDASTDSTAPLILNDLGLKLQTTVPSDIKKRNGEDFARSVWFDLFLFLGSHVVGASGSVASTLRGLQNKTVSTSVPES